MSYPVFQFGQGFALEQISRQQNLSIPGPIFSHMVKNPIKPQFFEKFIQACKYPFSKKKVIPVGYMRLFQNECKMAPTYETKNTKSIVVNLTEGTCKFWLNDFVCWEENEVDSPLLLDRLYRCDLNKFNLFDPVPFNVYQKLTSSGTLAALEIFGDIVHSDGSLATVEQLLGHLPNLAKIRWPFRWTDGPWQNNSVRTLEDAQCLFERFSHLQNLDLLDLTNLPEQWFPAFVDFVKKNKAVDVQLMMSVIVPAAYKVLIKAFMEETLLREETGDNPLVKVPIIRVEYPNDFDQVLSKRYNKLAISTTAGKKLDDYFL